MVASPAHPPPSSTTPTQKQRDHMRESYTAFVHNSALAGLIVAPILILLPPRKLDLYTFTLSGTFVISANQLFRERTGVGLLNYISGARGQQGHVTAPAQRLLEEPIPTARDTTSSLLEQRAKEMWIGKEKDWKEERLKEEQEKFAEGETRGGIIMDQIWQVWNWGEEKSEELKEKDEAVIAEGKKNNEFPKIGKD